MQAHFQLLSKPSSSVCNIDCTYCFYLEKKHLYPKKNRQWKMDNHTLENYVKQNILEQPSDIIEFVWQGGEPTLLGIDFYMQAIIYQTKYRGTKTITNSFQTNGILLDDKWCQFLKKHHFLVGISIDGPEQFHNSYRVNRSGIGVFDKVMKAIRLLQLHQVDFNVMVVVNDKNVNYPNEIYDFFKKNGCHYIQFTPLIERIASQMTKDNLTLISPDFVGESYVSEWSVPPLEYGQFLNTIFDRWFHEDIGKMFIINFENIMSKKVGGRHSCIMSEECGNNLALESNGDVYSCDHYVYPENRLGNINHDSMNRILQSSAHINFNKKKQSLPESCKRCEVKFFCNGGCPKHRFVKQIYGKPANYLCQSYKTHLTYVIPKIEFLVGHIQKQTPYTELMAEIKKLA